jgi:rhodanese-related sulfurtransferase
MMEAAERHIEDLDTLAAAFLGDRSTMQTIGRDELRTRMRAGDIVVIDVRPDAEFQAGHIRGALSIPTSKLKSRLSDIPADTEVVAYCRGPYCVMADDAVRYLNRQGRRALRLEGGYPQWAEEGRPVAAGAR